jgi:hypothetical protein
MYSNISSSIAPNCRDPQVYVQWTLLNGIKIILIDKSQTTQITLSNQILI